MGINESVDFVTKLENMAKAADRMAGREDSDLRAGFCEGQAAAWRSARDLVAEIAGEIEKRARDAYADVDRLSAEKRDRLAFRSEGIGQGLEAAAAMLRAGRVPT